MAISIKFSVNHGTVFTFDNPHGSVQYCYLRGFDCSYLSKFKEEDERLFFGGFHPIKVSNLRLIKGNLNFKVFIESIFYFDLLLNGAKLSEFKAKKKYFPIVDSFIKRNSAL